MKTEEIKHALQVLEIARKRYAEVKDNPSHDKTGFGFNLDDRFRIGKATVGLDGYDGVYGNSSCSQIAGNMGEAFQVALVVWLNANREAVLDGMAMQLRDELRSRKEAELVRIDAERKAVEVW